MKKTIEDYRIEIKEILENYYENLKKYEKFHIQAFSDDDVPEEMLTGEVEIEPEYNLELKTWKLIPSTVTEDDIAQLENTIGMRLPDVLRAYYTSYFHLFTFELNLSENSPNNKMWGIYNAYNELMIQCGYLPFTWDHEAAFLYCMKFDRDNNDCGIYLIDHEDMFSFDKESVTTEDIDKVVKFQAENFCEYLRKETNGLIEYLRKER